MDAAERLNYLSSGIALPSNDWPLGCSAMIYPGSEDLGKDHIGTSDIVIQDGPFEKKELRIRQLLREARDVLLRYEDCHDCGERYHGEDIAQYLTEIRLLNDEWVYVCGSCLNRRAEKDE